MGERKPLLADNALTTLEDVMEFLGMDETEERVSDLIKNDLERLINGASSYIETMTGRQFGRREYTERHYGSGSQELCLGQYPIVKILQIVDMDNGQLLSPASYSILEYGHVGVVYRDEGWARRGYVSGLAGDMTTGRRYLEACYTAGYILPKDATAECPSDLPYDLQYAIWQMVGQQWAAMSNGAGGLSAFSISDISWTFDKELGSQVQDVISRYTRWS